MYEYFFKIYAWGQVIVKCLGKDNGVCFSQTVIFHSSVLCYSILEPPQIEQLVFLETVAHFSLHF